MIKTIKSFFTSLSQKRQNVIAFSVIGIFALLLFRGAFYGIATPDESFYLTIPYRIILGDALLIDEWHASQLSAFLLYLPMKLFISITGSTDGIVLFFRCLFVFCQTAVSCFTYHRMKKYGFFPAIISSLLFLTYVVEQVHMLDYYTMTLMGFQVTGLILLTDDNLTKSKLVFTGIVFACTVTAQPFNALVYFIYSILVLLFFFKEKKKAFSDYTKKVFGYKTWLYITIGIILTAFVFIAFLLSQASLGELIKNIGNLFGGQDHNLPFSQEADSDMFSYLTIAKTLLNIAPISFVISLIVVILVFFDKKRNEHKKLWLYVSITATVLYSVIFLIYAFKNPAAILYRPYPLFLLAFIVIILKKEINKELLSLCIWGIIYIVFLGIISQALDHVGAIGFVISNTALIPAVIELSKEIKEDVQKIPQPKKKNTPKKCFSLSFFAATVSVILCSACIVAGAALECSDDISASVMGRKNEKAEITLSTGPLKGIKVGKSISKEYSELLKDVKTIKENTDGKILVTELIPWIYFCFDEPPATFTTWYIYDELYMYDAYYENEQHRPVCIYVPSTSFYWGYSNNTYAYKYIRFFKNMFVATSEKGETGTILYVNKMR